MSSACPRALCLISGGLDSTLAARLMLELGVDVIGVTFTSVFTRSGVIEGTLHGLRVAQEFGVPCIVLDVSEELLALVKKPRYGHGSHLNPCIDCRIMSLRHAAALLPRVGADFIVTGEVLGQRPMSQRDGPMRTVERESGLTGKLLRPLCAKCLPPTEIEKRGLVDRERLLDFRGRSRKPQLALAETFGITDYQSPAGGCCLTDPGFSARLEELLQDDPDCSLRDVGLLKFGRHFRLARGVKAIVARDAPESVLAEQVARPGDVLIELRAVKGPRTLVVGQGIRQSHCVEAAALTAHYSRHSRGLPTVDVRVQPVGSAELVLQVSPAVDARAAELCIGPVAGGRSPERAGGQ